MIEINIGNSYSRITGLSAKQEKELREALSYAVGGSSAYFSGRPVYKKSLLSKRGEFPTGLIHRLSIKADKVVDNRTKPPINPTVQLLSGTPYPWQVAAVKAAIKANRGIISAPTGTGKSMAMALLIAELNVKTLVVVPSIEIRRQLTEVFIGYGLRNVTVRNIDSIELKKSSSFDCLIIDECHHGAARTYQKLNKTVWHKIFYRFHFTATPFRNDAEETLLFEAIAGRIIYKLNYKTAIARGYIVPVEAFYIELPKQKHDCYTYQEVYRTLVTNNVKRNSIIHDILTAFDSTGKSTLCLVKEVAHGKNIGWPHFVSGEDDESRSLISDFNSRLVETLVGTEGIIGEGIDTKPCEIVVLAGLGKAKSRIMQAVGRGVRKHPGKTSCKVILFKDASNKYLLKHFREQCKILKDEYGVIPIKLEL